MKIVAFLLIAFIISDQIIAQTDSLKMKPKKIAIAVHGGAGNLANLNLTAEQEKDYKETLSTALEMGYEILKNGGSSIDAVTVAVKILEDSPLFNAGKGSVFTNEGINEMDAAIMDGSNLKCGAVTCVQTIKNPIEAARKVMEKSSFVLLSSKGAEKFAQEEGIELVDPSYFYTPYRWEQLQKAKSTDTIHLDNEIKGEVPKETGEINTDKFGTVGCVAIDMKGNLAAATSTGGIVNKKYNRIGDSPIIGAGTYANNKTCAVSCTGKGEDFIRLAVAHDISAKMEYNKASLKRAANKVILKKLKAINGRGGCIAIDKKGNIAMPFTTSGMFRGMIDNKGVKTVTVYRD